MATTYSEEFTVSAAPKTPHILEYELSNNKQKQQAKTVYSEIFILESE